MKRIVGLFAAAALLLTGCGTASTTAAAQPAAPSTAAPAAAAQATATAAPPTPTASATPPAIAPATATPAPSRSMAYQPSFLAPSAAEDNLNMTLEALQDPMVQHQEKQVTPEESAWRQDVLYQAVPEFLNESSLNYASAQDWANDMYSRGLITAPTRDHAYYNVMDHIMRDNGFGVQVRALYCPIHVQTATVFQIGSATCYFKANYVNAKDGSWIYGLAFDNMVGQAFYNDYFDTNMLNLTATATLAQEDGKWKVTSVKFDRACFTRQACSGAADGPAH